MTALQDPAPPATLERSSPRVASADRPDASWAARSALLASRAARTMRVSSGVRSATVEILGDPEAPVLRAQLSVAPGEAFSSSVTEFMDTVVPRMERDLGVPFVTHEVDFSIAETSRTRGAAATPVLTIV